MIEWTTETKKSGSAQEQYWKGGQLIPSTCGTGQDGLTENADFHSTAKGN